MRVRNESKQASERNEWNGVTLGPGVPRLICLANEHEELHSPRSPLEPRSPGRPGIPGIP